MRPDWDERYRTGDIPWDSGVASHELQRVLDAHAIEPCRALEPGCGTGVNSLHLADRGFDVTGFDLSPRAIEAARARLNGRPLHCRFMVADVFNLPDLGAPFAFIFDRGCYHVVRGIDERSVVDAYERLLVPGGRALILAGSANDPAPPEGGPPRVSEAELRAAFEHRFAIENLHEFRFDTQPGRDFRPLAWSLLLRKPS